jgi:hypothetical protein
LYRISEYGPVSCSGYFLHDIASGNYCFQPFGLDMEENPPGKPDFAFAHGCFLVCSWPVLRYRILSFTQWHWDVLHHLGQYNLPNSYIKYLVLRITGVSFSDKLVDNVTAVCFFLALGLSLYFNLKGRKKDH